VIRPASPRQRHLIRISAAVLGSLLIAFPACLPALAASEPKEKEAEFRKQLAAGEVQLVEVNKLLRRAHVVLKDGRRVIYKYPSHHTKALIAELQGRHIQVTVLSKHQAKTEAKSAQHSGHKLRYIVGGVVIAVIVIVAVALLLIRRRRRE
jgi:hypothetical protein